MSEPILCKTTYADFVALFQDYMVSRGYERGQVRPEQWVVQAGLPLADGVGYIAPTGNGAIVLRVVTLKPGLISVTGEIRENSQPIAPEDRAELETVLG